jgi:sugar lactone lactonase YvrE
MTHTRRDLLRVVGTAAGAVAATTLIPSTANAASASAAAAARKESRATKVFSLPDGWAPEGIETSPAGVAYVTSRVSGSIFRLNLFTGTGSVLFTGPGTPSLGLKLDRRGRLFVAGGTGGNARVVNARTGALLATYTLTAPGASFVNDVILMDGAAYFTDSTNPVLYKVALGRHGQLPAAAETIPLTGVAYSAGINVNGIATGLRHGELLLVQSNTGLLFSVDARTGAGTALDLGGELVTNGDGILRIGHTLYVVRNQNNEIAVVRLHRGGGEIVNRLTDPAFDIPTTVAAFGGRLYLPNARFSTPVTPTTPYSVVGIGI